MFNIICDGSYFYYIELISKFPIETEFQKIVYDFTINGDRTETKYPLKLYSKLFDDKYYSIYIFTDNINIENKLKKINIYLPHDYNLNILEINVL